MLTKPELKHWMDKQDGFDEFNLVSVNFEWNVIYEDKMTVSGKTKGICSVYIVDRQLD